KKVRDVLMFGTDKKGDLGTGTSFEGVIPNLQRRFENTESEWVKARLHQYMSEQPCEVCHGTRLRKEALAVRLHTIDGKMPSSPHELHTSGPSCAVRTASDSGAESSRSTGYQPVPEGNGKSKKSGAKQHGLVARATEAAASPSLPGFSVHDVALMNVEHAKRFFENL